MINSLIKKITCPPCIVHSHLLFPSSHLPASSRYQNHHLCNDCSSRVKDSISPFSICRMKFNFDIYNLKMIFLNKLGIFAPTMLKQLDILNSRSLIFLHLVCVLHRSMAVKLQSEIWLSLCRSIWLSPMSFGGCSSSFSVRSGSFDFGGCNFLVKTEK
jgi:hypothetical protein